MQQHLKRSALILICILGLYDIGYSQSTYKVKETKGFDVKISGTSTLHDWEMNAVSSIGEAQFTFKPGSETDIVSIKSLSINLQVKDLKSDNSALDNNAYKALKSEEYKHIRYILTSSLLIAESGGYLIKSIGNLTIAGVTKEITMYVHCVVNADGTITFKGSYALNMTDYNVQPPSFMWGAMKTGDYITMSFLVVYTK